MGTSRAKHSCSGTGLGHWTIGTSSVISSSDICLNVKGLVRGQNRGSPSLEEEEMSFDNQRMIFNLVTLVQFFSIPVMSSSLMLRCQKVKIFFGAKGQNFQQGLLSVFHMSF